MRGRLLSVTSLAATALLLGLAVGATAEQVARDGVRVALDGSISPRKLPRDRPVPVSLTLSGWIRDETGSTPPRLAEVDVAFGARGGLSTDGLPRCPLSRLRNATRRQALARCRGALVGHGAIVAEVPLSNDAPLAAHADALAFNGLSHGRPAVWVHAYSSSPPVSFVLPFYLRRLPEGTYGMAIRTQVAKALGRWPRLRSFRLTLGRRYTVDGEKRSYLSARCHLPPRFRSFNIPLARATYRFTPGPTLTVAKLGSCRVRD